MGGQDDRVADLRRVLLRMAVSAEERVSTALEALVRKDVAMARSVHGADREINSLELEVEAECFRLLNEGVPDAGDLRFVLSTLHINREIERAADLAKGVAKRVLDLCDQTPITMPPELEEMAVAAQLMLGNATRALRTQDEALAEEVRRADDFVDKRFKQIFKWAFVELESDAERAKAVIDLISVARAIERIGDISTNIAEDTLFALGGAVVRHTPID